MNIQEAIKQSNVLREANPASLAVLIHDAVLRRLKKGNHLFFDKDQVRHIYIMVNGIAALYKLDNKEEKRVIFICGAGQLLNEVILDGAPASVNCEILCESQVICFEKDRFLEACRQDFVLSKSVIDSMSLKIRRLYHQMKNTNNTMRGDRRIAAKLWKLSKDHGVGCSRGTKIEFNLTITYLADLLGSKRETVSRQLKLLTDQGLVVLDRNRFIIPDRDALLDYFYEA